MTNSMQKVIEKILKETPGLKGRRIAQKAGTDHKSVNSFLHKHKAIFAQDSNYCWSLAQSVDQVLELDSPWVTANSFEQSLLQTGCLLSSGFNSVLVKIPGGCKILLIAADRLLALLNQIVPIKKDVAIDLTECAMTKSFLSRVGFFDHLDKRVNVIPKRPNVSSAKIYQGNSDTLVEFGAIDLQQKNKELIVQLGTRFVQQSDSRYETAALTIFSELIGNVREHSKSPIPGFAALQKYEGKRKHIQTVVSDSGLGIAKTLRPSLKKHYHSLYKLYNEKNIQSDAGLVKVTLSKGEISRFGSGRGLGFKSSREQATKFDAEFSVRQDRFYLNFKYKNGKLVDVEQHLGIPKIMGTHLCFDFFVDDG